MRLSAFNRMHVVHKEEKEARLKDFIKRDLDARRAAAPGMPATTYRLVALSSESPVAKALVEFADEAATLGIAIHIVYLRNIAGTSDMIPHATCRIATDRRLVDAHEQLVLGDMTAWIGDCMRREPSKRDGFECYAEGCAETAAWAARSFEHMWNTTKPATRGTATRKPAETPGEALLDASMMANPDTMPDAVALRH